MIDMIKQLIEVCGFPIDGFLSSARYSIFEPSVERGKKVLSADKAAQVQYKLRFVRNYKLKNGLIRQPGTTIENYNTRFLSENRQAKRRC